jgi:hypothetical protein
MLDITKMTSDPRSDTLSAYGPRWFNPTTHKATCIPSNDPSSKDFVPWSFACTCKKEPCTCPEGSCTCKMSVVIAFWILIITYPPMLDTYGDYHGRPEYKVRVSLRCPSGDKWGAIVDEWAKEFDEKIKKRPEWTTCMYLSSSGLKPVQSKLGTNNLRVDLDEFQKLCENEFPRVLNDVMPVLDLLRKYFVPTVREFKAATGCTCKCIYDECP